MICCGFEHVMVLLQEGLVATWGYGGSGCLGHGNYETFNEPKIIEHPNIIREKIVYIESGGYHNGAISENG